MDIKDTIRRVLACKDDGTAWCTDCSTAAPELARALERALDVVEAARMISAQVKLMLAAPADLSSMDEWEFTDFCRLRALDIYTRVIDTSIAAFDAVP